MSAAQEHSEAKAKWAEADNEARRLRFSLFDIEQAADVFSTNPKTTADDFLVIKRMARNARLGSEKSKPEEVEF